MTRNLPDFANPPLAEVALSVQFEPLEKLRTPQIGLLWNEFRQRFPATEEHAPLDSEFERFGIPRTSAPIVRMQMLETLPVPRVWFLNEAGTELIQVQQDRFIHNWRKVGEGDAYPRYERLRQTFQSELEAFQAIVAREQCGEIVPNQCEVTYVNHIVAGEGWTNHGQLSQVLTMFQTNYSDDRLGEPEDARLSIRFILRDDDQKPIGRLHAAVQPVFRREDNQPMFVVTLTARFRPAGERIEDVLCCLDRGREVIVRAFASMTTPQMHQVWGRKDA